MVARRGLRKNYRTAPGDRKTRSSVNDRGDDRNYSCQELELVIKVWVHNNNSSNTKGAEGVTAQKMEEKIV